MLKYIITSLVLATLWAAVWVLDLSWIFPAVCTFLAVAAFVALFVYRRVKSHQAATELERSLAAQGEAQLSNVRPDQQAEIQAMQAEFAKAIGTLKSSKLARGRKDALSILPWYLIIGPPGAGKSTALRKSGLQFPYLSAKGGGVRGVGGTRNCEWWLTNEAVILDTAGRYTTEDEDQDEWFAFLDMLARHRPRRPVNGLIVAVSAGDLLGMTDGVGAAQLGERIRERLNEVTERLGMVVPVYLLVTKCDLLTGFVETFGTLSKTDRGQIWGFTLPLEERLESPADIARERLDELSDVLDGVWLRRLGEERHPESRERIFQFPRQFDALREPLTELLGTLFASNVYQDAPAMRGVYFSSGTQEAKLLDKVVGAMADAFGMGRKAATGAQQALESRSYFLRELFSSVIFPDQNLAVRSSAETRRQKLVQYAYAGGGLLLAALLLFFPAVAYVKNRALVRSVAALVEPVAPGQEVEEHVDLEAVLAHAELRAKLEELRRAQEEGPPLSMQLGMYQGDSLFGPLSTYYGTIMRRALVEPLINADVEEITQMAAGEDDLSQPAGGRAYAHLHDQLRLHLLTTSPRGESEAPLEGLEVEWLAQNIADRWSRSARVARDAQVEQELRDHALLYVRLLALDPSLALPRNALVVRKARRALSGVPPAQLAVEQLLSDPALSQYDLTAGQVLGSAVTQVRTKARVRGAFTIKGWNAVMEERLKPPFKAPGAWVLGPQGKKKGEDGDSLTLAARSYYFARYIDEWRSFLAALRIEQPSSNDEALGMLRELTRGKPPPFGRLFRAVAANVRLTADDGGLGKAATSTFKKKLKQKLRLGKDLGDGVEGAVRSRMDGGEEDNLLEARDVEQAFEGLLTFGVAPSRGEDEEAEPTPLDMYQEQLVFLADAMRGFLDTQEPGPLQARLQAARVRVRSLIDAQEVGWRPRLDALLWPPVEGVTRTVMRGQAANLGQAWCNSVVSSFDELAQRYPFNRSGHDASLADMTEFFRPESGTVWSFYNTSLKEFVARQGARFSLVVRPGGTPITPQVPSYLNRANEVTSALFTSGAKEPSVQFAIHIHPAPKLASITFSVDGRSVEYRNGPEQWHSFQWPGEGTKLGASVRARNARGVTETIEQEGEWGLFRLLELGALRGQGGARVFTVTWKVPTLDTEVTIDFRPVRGETPFLGSGGTLLAPFRQRGVTPPRTLARADKGCQP